MKRIFYTLVLIAVTISASAQTANELLQKAYTAYQNKDWKQSASFYKQGIEKGTDDVNQYYNAACAFALAGNKDTAFLYLEGAIKKGYFNASHMQKDTDFQSLYSDARWPLIVEKIKAKEKATKNLWDNPALKTAYKPDLAPAEKAAGVSKVWSEVKFNFANFDLVPQLNWDSVYLSSLKEASETKSTVDYYRVLMRMIAQLQDGHTNVYPNSPEMANIFYAQPPFRARLVEDKVIVRTLFDETPKAEGITIGTEIISINQMPVKEYAAKYVRPYQSASTPQDMDMRTYEYSLLSGPVDEPLTIEFKDAKGKTFTRTIKRLPVEELRKLRNATPAFRLTWLKGNIAHVELNSFGNDEAADQFIKHFDEIAKADALILDVRNNGGGNSNVGYRVLGTLTNETFATSNWHTRDYRPTYRAWGRAEGTTGASNTFPANGKLLYQKPVVVLTSPGTYSAAEDFAVAFDYMKRGKIVGETTGGSTGQPLMFDLPGGGGARVCTKRDTYPDGREFVGVGVKPQVFVKPTVADVRKGKDTVLEAALKELK